MVYFPLTNGSWIYIGTFLRRAQVLETHMQTAVPHPSVHFPVPLSLSLSRHIRALALRRYVPTTLISIYLPTYPRAA